MEFYMPSRLVAGANCVGENASRLAALGKRCLLVTSGSAARRSGALADVCAALEGQGIAFTLFGVSARADNAVLGVNYKLNTLRQPVCDKLRNTNAEINDFAVMEHLRNAPCDYILVIHMITSFSPSWGWEQQRLHRCRKR